MTIKEKLATVITFKDKRRINACVRQTMASLDNESMSENTLAPDSPDTLLQRALNVFGGLKPLLLFLSTFGLLPLPWRTGLTLLVQVLEALAAVGPKVTVHFKAGKDLDAAA